MANTKKNKTKRADNVQMTEPVKAQTKRGGAQSSASGGSTEKTTKKTGGVERRAPVIVLPAAGETAKGIKSRPQVTLPTAAEPETPTLPQQGRVSDAMQRVLDRVNSGTATTTSQPQTSSVSPAMQRVLDRVKSTGSGTAATQRSFGGSGRSFDTTFYKNAGTGDERKATKAPVTTPGGYYDRPEYNTARLETYSRQAEGWGKQLEEIGGRREQRQQELQSMANEIRWLQEEQIPALKSAVDQATSLEELLAVREQSEWAQKRLNELLSTYTAAKQELGAMDQQYSRVLEGFNTAVSGYDAEYAKYKEGQDAWRQTVRSDRDAIRKDLDAATAARTRLEERNREITDRIAALQGQRVNLEQAQREIGQLQNRLYVNESQLADAKKQEQLLRDELDYSTYFGFEAYRERADFAEKSKFQEDSADTAYRAVNKDAAEQTEQQAKAYSTNGALIALLTGVDKAERQQMTEDEVALYNYLYATEPEKAEEYLDWLTSSLYGRQRREREARWAEAADKNFGTRLQNHVASTILSVPLKAAAFIGQLADYADDGKIDQNAPYNVGAHFSSAVRRKLTEHVAKKGGSVAAFLYQTETSMQDFLYTAAITGGLGSLGGALGVIAENASLLLMASGAAADSIIENKDKGYTDEQALALGVYAGFAEYITEKVSLETLLDATNMGRNAAGYIAKNFLAEGSEEVAADFINLFADILVMKDKSEWRASVEKYVHGGYSEAEAFGRAVGDQALKMGVSFLGGALSGGVMGGAAVAINAIGNAIGNVNYGRQLNQIESEIRAETFRGLENEQRIPTTLEMDGVTRRLLESGLSAERGTEARTYANKLLAQLESGRELSNYEMGRMAQLNEIQEAEDRKNKIKREPISLPTYEENLRREQAAAAQENAAEEAAETGERTLVRVIRDAIPQIQDMEPVAEVTGDEIPKNGTIVERLTSFINGLGNKVNRPGLGDVLFSRKKIKSSMIGHGVGNAKIETFAAVPAVIQSGRQIDYQENWKGRGYDTYTFAAPVTYRGNPTYLGVIVAQDRQSSRYYVHEVVDENGNVIFTNEETAPDTSDTRAARTGAYDSVVTGEVSEPMVSQPEQTVNGIVLPTAEEARGVVLPTAEYSNNRAENLNTEQSSTGQVNQEVLQNGEQRAETQDAAANIVLPGGEQQGAEYRRVGEPVQTGRAVYRGDTGWGSDAAQSGAARDLRSLIEKGRDHRQLIKQRQQAAVDGPLVSARELGAESGTDSQTLHVYSESMYVNDAEAREAVAMLEANGFRDVTAVTGLLQADAGTGPVGVNDITDTKKGKAILRADSLKQTMGETAVHVLAHKVQTNRQIAEFRDTVKSRYREGAWGRLYEVYRAKWAKLTNEYEGFTPEQEELYVWEEILCDAFAGRNNYGTTASVYADLARDILTPSVNSWSQPAETAMPEEQTTPVLPGNENAAATERTNGPPEESNYSVAEEEATAPENMLPTMERETEEETVNGIIADVNAEYDAESESVNPAERYSADTWNESDYVTDRKQAAKEIAQAIGVSVRKATQYIDDINSVARAIVEDRGRYDYEDTGLSSFVSNAEYGGSLDFNTLCPKRRLLTGTFTAIQQALPNTALTAEEILDIRRRMDEAGLVVSCGKCYVEGSRANMGRFAQEFIRLYERDNPGAWVPNMAEINTPDGVEWVRLNHPEVYEQYEYFWNHYGRLQPGDKALFASQQKPKLYQMRTAYKGEILSRFARDGAVEEKNRNGGLRLQSFSDFEIVHLIDAMQAIMDMSRVGLAGQAYTKQPEFAWALGGTGLKINLSIDAWGVDADGRLTFNNKEGMDFDEAMRLRDAYPKNVGTICCVYNDAQLMAAMADPRIDFIIPFHRSQWSTAQYKGMGLPQTTKDYTDQQNEKWLEPDRHTHEYKGRQVPTKCENLKPNEYWDFSRDGKWNAENYLRLCAEEGRRPKFYKLLVNNGDGSYSLQPDGSTDGYWKLLSDYKMYDNDGVGSPQTPVRPTFNMQEVNRMLQSYEGGQNSFPVAQGIVDEFVADYKAKRPGQERYSIEEIDGQVMPVIDTENDTREFSAAENYLKALVDTENPFATILYDAQPVYIGPDLPGEYRSSEYTKSLREALRKTKMQAATNLDEMLLLAENGKWRENVKEKHAVDAMNGWYRYETEFAVPIKNIRQDIDHYTVYGGTLLIRNDADGNSYLYDLIDLQEKKERASGPVPSLHQSSPVAATRQELPDTPASVSEPAPYTGNRPAPYAASRIADEAQNVNRYSAADEEYMDAYFDGDDDRMQELVDQAARDAGYDTPKLYHGTNGFGFTVLDTDKSDDKISFFATDSELMAGTYAEAPKYRNIGDYQRRSTSADPKTLHGEDLLEEAQKRLSGTYIGDVSIDDLEVMPPYWRQQYISRITSYELPPVAEALNNILNGQPVQTFEADDGTDTWMYDQHSGEMVDRHTRQRQDEIAQELLQQVNDDPQAHRIARNIIKNIKTLEYETSDARIITEADEILRSLDKLDNMLPDGLLRAHLIKAGYNAAKDLRSLANGGDIYYQNDYGDFMSRGNIVTGETLRNKIADREEWGNGGIYALYAKSEGQLVVTTSGDNWNQIHISDRTGQLLGLDANHEYTTRQLARAAYEKGYKSIKITGLYDIGANFGMLPTKVDELGDLMPVEDPMVDVSNEPHDVYIFFDPQSQVKSADPVTYDENGDVIPLSERFRTDRAGEEAWQNKDIRYSAEDEEATAQRTANVPKEEFQGTTALEKLGVKVENSVGLYHNVKQLLETGKAAYRMQKMILRDEVRLRATDAEKNFASGIAANVYEESDIPKSMRRDVVEELADLYTAAEALGAERIRGQRAQISEALSEKMEELFQDSDNFKPSKAIVLNYRTPERNMLHIFGDKRGKAINDALFTPVAVNEAERFRFNNQMFDEVRRFENSKGKKKKLTKLERALVQQVIEGKAAAEMVAEMETQPAIRNAAQRLRNGNDLDETARELGLDAEEQKAALKYAQWLETQETLKSGKADTVKVDNAVKKYSEMFDLFYDAINDFLVAHGYEPIGFIKGYAPHLQPEQNQNLLNKAFESLGINTDVTRLPTSIAGLTANYRPNKRWNPYFLTRTGDVTEYDIASAYESYVDYMSDILYHTDDIMRVREASKFFRKTYAPEEIKNNLEWANELRFGTTEQKAGFLRDNGVIGKSTTMSPADIDRRMEEYVDKLYSDITKTTKYSELVSWLDNYANILAGKQSIADRSAEAMFGRNALNVGNKLMRTFGRSNVAGSISSALNQFTQIPMIQAELGTKWTAAAIKDIVTGKTRKGGWDGQSDFLTGKKGIDYLVTTPGEMVLTAMFTPAELADRFTATVAVRGKYLQEISNGKSHAEAMKAADKFGTEVMGSRMKGSKPVAFHSKNPIYQMINIFQIEAFNTWEHVSQDLPRDFREIERTQGKSKAALALAAVIVRALMFAFAGNRLADEIYGGTPAPFDLFGLTANFIASGEGLGTNEYIRTLIDNGWEKVTGERLFDTDADKIGDDDFMWEQALEDLGYNVSNDIPFLRNVSGLLGLGDETLPMPNIYGGITDLVKSIKDNGIGTLDTGKAALALLAQLIPGGRQLNKTALGLETVLRGGDFSKGKLKYPTEGTPWTDAQAILFGKYATQASDNYYASGRGPLSAKQTALWEELKSQGMDPQEAYEAVLGYKAISGDKDLTTDEKYEAISDSEFSDEVKEQFLGELMGSTEKLTEAGNLSAYGKMQEVLESGLDMGQYVDLRNAKAIDRYLKNIDNGLGAQLAYDTAMALKDIDSDEDISKAEKWRLMLEMSNDPQEQAQALSTVMSKTEYANLQLADQFGFDPEVSVILYETLPDYDFDGNGYYKQPEVEAAIDAMSGSGGIMLPGGGTVTLTNAEKAALWQIWTGSKSAKNNPYDTDVGQQVIDAKAAAKGNNG